MAITCLVCGDKLTDAIFHIHRHYFEHKEIQETLMMNDAQLTYSSDGWRVALLNEDTQDTSCNWRTYVATNGNKFFTFHLPNELKGSGVEFRKRFHDHLEANTKETQMNKPAKMTREQALDKCKNLNNWPDILEALDVIEFEKPAAINKVFELEYESKLSNKLVAVRLEEWPEGLVLWVGGEIVWKSWERFYKKGDSVVITGSNLNSSIIGNIK